MASILLRIRRRYSYADNKSRKLYKRDFPFRHMGRRAMFHFASLGTSNETLPGDGISSHIPDEITKFSDALDGVREDIMVPGDAPHVEEFPPICYLDEVISEQVIGNRSAVPLGLRTLNTSAILGSRKKAKSSGSSVSSSV
jgi:hypothetical protein